jgi:hypothetical protein
LKKNEKMGIDSGNNGDWLWKKWGLALEKMGTGSDFLQEKRCLSPDFFPISLLTNPCH